MKGTIRSSRRISELFDCGEKCATSNVLAIFSRVEPNSVAAGVATVSCEGRIAILAGKRLGSAPVRNRAKRRLREAARTAGAPWYGFDVVLVARDRSLRCAYDAQVADMRKIADKLAKEAQSNDANAANTSKNALQ